MIKLNDVLQKEQNEKFEMELLKSAYFQLVETTKRLKESEEKFSSAFINSPHPIIITRLKDGSFVDANPSFITLTGYTMKEIMSGSTVNLRMWVNFKDREHLVSRLSRGVPVTRRECLFKTKNGKVIVALLSAREIMVKREQCILANIIDITELKQIEDEMRRSELFFKESQNAASIGSYSLDIKTGEWTSSAVLDNIFGIDHSPHKNYKIWLDAVYSGDKKMVDQYYKIEVLGKHKSFNKEYRIVRKSDGAIRWVLGLGKLALDSKNRVISMIGTIQDITEHKEMEDTIVEINGRNESILSSIGDAVMAVDQTGKIIVFNRMAEQMAGLAAKIAIGKHYSKVVNFIKESNRKKCSDFIGEALKYNKVTEMANHALLVRNDGKEIPVADSAAPIKNGKGEILGCVVVFRDMTRERKIDKAKTEFVSLASHQLRTPLSTINWYSEVLLSEDIGKLTPKQKQYSHEVYHASQRMVALVNALLNTSRLELGTFAVEPKMVSIVKIAKTCIKELQPQIVAKTIKLEERYSRNIDLLNLDPKLMGIIFQNLLSNAVKYNKNKGEIELKIENENDKLIITVADTGIGIPKDQQKNIFQKLYRADNAKMTDPDGTGLGLYIVNEIISYTGGSIRFESSERKGTKFYVTLPISGMKKKTSSKQLI